MIQEENISNGNTIEWLKPVISHLRNNISIVQNACIRYNGTSMPLISLFNFNKAKIFSKHRETTVSCEKLNIPITNPHEMCSKVLELPSQRSPQRSSVVDNSMSMYRMLNGLNFHLNMMQVMNYWALYPNSQVRQMKSHVGIQSVAARFKRMKTLSSYLQANGMMSFKIIATNFMFVHPELGIRVTIDALLEDTETNEIVLVEFATKEKDRVGTITREFKSIFEKNRLKATRTHQINLEASIKNYLFADCFRMKTTGSRVLFITSFNQFNSNSKRLEEKRFEIKFRDLGVYAEVVEHLLIWRTHSTTMHLNSRPQESLNRVDTQKLNSWNSEFSFDHSFFQFRHFEEFGPEELVPVVNSSPNLSTSGFGKRRRKAILRNSKRRKKLKLGGKIFHECERFSAISEPLTISKSPIPHFVQSIRKKSIDFNRIRYIGRRLLLLYVADCETISDKQVEESSFLKHVFAMVTSTRQSSRDRAQSCGLITCYKKLCMELGYDDNQPIFECRNVYAIMNNEARKLVSEFKTLLDYGMTYPMLHYIRAKYSCVFHRENASQNEDLRLIPRSHAFYIVDRIRGIRAQRPSTLTRDVESIIEEERRLYEQFVVSKKMIQYRKYMLQTIDSLNEQYPLSSDSNEKKLSFKTFELIPVGKLKHASMTLDVECLVAILNESLKPNGESDQHIKDFQQWYNNLDNANRTKWDQGRHSRGRGLTILDFFPEKQTRRVCSSRAEFLIGNSITTNGFKISKIFNKNVIRCGTDGKGSPKWRKRSEKVEDIDHQPEFITLDDVRREQLAMKNIITCDTGMHYLFYGRYEDSNGKKKYMYYSGRRFRHNSGIQKLNLATRRRQTGSQVFTDAQKELTNYTTKTMNRENLYRAVAKQISLYDTMSNVMNSPFLLRMRFAVDSKKKKTMYDVLNHMTLNGTKTLIVGDGGKGSYAGTHGTCAGPLTKILRLAKRAKGYNVHFFDESYTTANSHCCAGSKTSKLVQYYKELNELRKSRTGKKRKKRELVKSSEAKNEGVLKCVVNGVVICQSCQHRYNRDKHSSDNLWNLFAAFIRGEERDKFFTRAGQVTETQSC